MFWGRPPRGYRRRRGARGRPPRGLGRPHRLGPPPPPPWGPGGGWVGGNVTNDKFGK